MRLLDRFRFSLGNGYVMPLDTRMTGLLTTYREGGYERIAPVFQAYAEQAYQANGIVFAVILARAMLLSEATFKFQDVTTKKLFGSPALSKLENPWPGGTTGDLIVRMEQDASLAGQAFIRDAGDRLERMRPDRVVRILGELEDGSYEIAGYGYDRDGTGDPLAEVYPVSEVADWTPIPDPMSQYRGMSWLTPVVREIESDSAMTTHKGRFFDNAATPNLLVKYQQELKEAKFNQLSAQLKMRHTGAENAWKTLILDNGADATVIGANFEQMAFTAVQAAGENRIAAAGGVPAIVVGLKEGLDAATYSNYGMAMRRFADITARPTWRSMVGALARIVDPQAGARLWFDTVDIAALQEGEQQKAETSRTLAVAAGELIRAGFDPDSVIPALTADDFTLLIHTGAIPTALYPGGQDPSSGRSLAVPEVVQKVYLGVVNKVISAEEARQMINDAGGNLTGPAPAPTTGGAA